MLSMKGSKSIELWKKRFKRWKEGKNIRIEVLTGRKYIKNMEEELQKRGIIKPSELQQRRVMLKIGDKKVKATANAYLGAMYPIMLPKLQAYAMRSAGFGGSLTVRKLLEKHDIKVPTCIGSRVSGAKTVKKMGKIFETGRIPHPYYVISKERAREIYPPEVVEILLKEIGGKATAFLLKRFRYAERE